MAIVEFEKIKGEFAMTSNQFRTHRHVGSLAVAVALIALLVSIYSFLRTSQDDRPAQTHTQIPGLVETILNDGVINAGYGVYPPYTLEDPNTQGVSGFSVEIIERIAAELNCKVKWSRISWDTMSADLKRGAYDVIADPIFQTIPRAPEFAFTEPYTYFPDGIAVVRSGETRFSGFQDLDQEGIKIAVGLGQASEALVKARFSHATVEPVAVGTDNMQIFNGVLSGRSDVAVADLPNAKRFVDEHPGEVQALWLDAPPAYMPAGFALRPSDRQGAEFLNTCLRNLKSTGVLMDLARKYDIPSVDSPK